MYSTNHFTNTKKHSRSLFCEYVIDSIPFQALFLLRLLFSSIEQETKNRKEQNRRTTSTKPSNSFLFIMHSVHKVYAFKHRNFSFFQSAKTGPGVHPATYSTGNTGLSAGEG